MNFINFSYVTCWAQNLLIPPVYYSQQNITVVNAINEILLRFNLSLQHCWEQKYNGANNMMGNKSVVATGLEVEQLKDLFTHC